jgi:sulfate adenylyltransferase subunit 1
VVLVDATKLKWQDPTLTLLPQTRRHTLLAHLLRVPSIVFAINKLDAVDDPARAYTHIRAALTRFAQEAGVTVRALIPISALQGHNVVSARAGWCGYQGPSLLQLLETLEVTPAETQSAFAFPVQWVEKFHDTADTSRGRRIFWGRVAAGTLAPGQSVQVLPGGQTARVAEVLNHVRVPQAVAAGHSAGLILDREVDVSRGDWLLAPEAAAPSRTLSATVAWLDDEPLVAGRVYWALHGHRWVKAKVTRIVHRVDIHTLQEASATQLEANAIGHIDLALQEPLATRPYARSRALGGLVLVDTATHKTAGAVLVRAPQAA